MKDVVEGTFVDGFSFFHVILLFKFQFYVLVQLIDKENLVDLIHSCLFLLIQIRQCRIDLLFFKQLVCNDCMLLTILYF